MGEPDRETDAVFNLGMLTGVGSNIPPWVLWHCVDYCESQGFPIKLIRDYKPERGDGPTASPTA